MTTKQIILKRIDLMISQRFSGDYADLEKPEVFLTEADHLIMTFRSYMYGETQHEETREVVYPSSWWDHFKKRFFKGFLLRKFPVKYTTERINFRVLACYPDFKPSRDYKFVSIPLMESEIIEPPEKGT